MLFIESKLTLSVLLFSKVQALSKSKLGYSIFSFFKKSRRSSNYSKMTQSQPANQNARIEFIQFYYFSLKTKENIYLASAGDFGREIFGWIGKVARSKSKVDAGSRDSFPFAIPERRNFPNSRKRETENYCVEITIILEFVK